MYHDIKNRCLTTWLYPMKKTLKYQISYNSINPYKEKNYPYERFFFPKKTHKFSILRSPFVNKNSFEHFGIKTIKVLLPIQYYGLSKKKYIKFFEDRVKKIFLLNKKIKIKKIFINKYF